MKIFVVFLLASASANPQFLKGAKETYESVKARLQCAEMPNDGTCAILFDDDDCTGWQLKVKEGYTELPEAGGLKKLFIDDAKEDDAEAVLVRKGCVLVGYDHKKGHSKGLGDAVVIAAVDAHKYQDLSDDGFDDLDEEISAVDCVCSGFAFSESGSTGPNKN
ncbi:uncharacterized protein LOC111711720 [Eurytemora carolleeae]|uniref:uncharacterized protein LOC111711720 n=1 Tax=Eurytemora carolleeae TaxID=1294199 RepID=UPI000C75A6D3|nr:uncharacterized protein LOC111711720 [Eurytemora carolleeae]|eukprot:XP_023341910.1 uncharacterized protein LOC111711720 [Eurytemora affinis]